MLSQEALFPPHQNARNSSAETTTRMIAEVFNPHPVIYSQEDAGLIGHEPQPTQV